MVNYILTSILVVLGVVVMPIGTLLSRSATLSQGRRSLVNTADSDITIVDEALRHCLDQQKVLWVKDGKCYSLLSTGPCRPGQWLVLRRIIMAQDKGLQVLVTCQRIPCEDATAIYWQPTGQCVMVYNTGSLCGGGRGTVLRYNALGRSVCGCGDYYVLNGGRCWLKLHRGPCAEGEMISLEGSCQPDSCRELNAASNDTSHPYMFFEGRCVKLWDVCDDDVDTVAMYGRRFVQIVNGSLHCDYNRGYHFTGAPDFCPQDITGGCILWAQPKEFAKRLLISYGRQRHSKYWTATNRSVGQQ